ncbi:FAD/NAD-P-binding domain-containing protein [Trametes punicea]|nr:FAD/NAD-P-binding domain-containing protein [Trametes punicea]
MPNFTVAIIGAGLGGLAFAVFLQKYAPDVEFHVYEAAAQLTEIGAGIGCQPRTWYVLRELGLDAALLKISGNGEKSELALLYRKSDQRDGFTFGNSETDKKNYTFHRAELQKVFIDHLQERERIHLGKRFVSYSQTTDSDGGRVEIRFQDGSTATCDLLVGADGIKSSVRAALYAQLAEAARKAGHEEEARFLDSCVAPVFTGSVIFRTLVKPQPDDKMSPEALNRTNMMMYCGKNRHIVAYPVAQGRVLNVAAVVTSPELEGTTYQGPWVAQVPREQVDATFKGWEPGVEEILKQAAGDSCWKKWAVHSLKALPTFFDGRVALLGDAAHAMAPYQGAGAGQGFEDALLLGQLLGQPKINRDAIPTALKLYDEFRRPVAQHVGAVSLQSGQLHSLIAPELAGVTPEDSASGKAPTRRQLEQIAREIEGLKEWRNYTTVEKDCVAAIRKLEDLLP